MVFVKIIIRKERRTKIKRKQRKITAYIETANKKTPKKKKESVY